MKRRLSLLMTLVIALCTSSAWAQSVVSVGTNLDFSEGTPVDNGICTYGKDMATNNTTYYGELAVDGWTAQPKGTTDDKGYENSSLAGGLFAYGSGHWLGGADYNVPATNPEGVAEGNALGIIGVWSGTVQYVQAVTLEPGDYVISALVYNAVGGTTAFVKNLIGFIADNGTEYLASTKTYAVDTWTVENIKFTLTETTAGKLSLGYAAAGTGSGGNQHLFIDKVEVLAVTEADLARIDLNAALVSAQATVDAKVGVGAGVFMYSEEAYNAYAAAVAAAKAVSENAEATKDELVEALAALNAATAAYTVTVPAADAIYAVKFNGSDNYLTIGESTITIDAAVDTLSFEAVGNGKYYVHDNAGKYIYYSGTGNNIWSMSAAADKKDEWTISVNAEGLYAFVGKNGGIGVDGTEAGASCYGDKKGAAMALWTITEIVIEDEPVVKTDYTDAIVNADLSTTEAWDASQTKGIKDGMVKVGGNVFDFTQTITLPAGQYKMTAKAAYRYANGTKPEEEYEYNQIQAGVETHLAKLYAETSSYKYEANVMNRWDGASDTDFANGSGSVTVNGKFVPNSSAAVQAWFNAGQYVNELIFNVQEDGAVKIGIAKTENCPDGDYTNIGAWTLTRLGDAEADPKGEEPAPDPEEPEETIDMDLTHLVGTSKEAWNATGGPVNIDGISMPENFQDDSSITGVVLWQDVTGLENGKYTVELWANARVAWRESAATDGQEELTYLVANNVEISMQVLLNPGLNNNATYVLEGVEVTDGTLHIEMNKKAAGSNWHTIQIKSLIYHAPANAALDMAKADLKAALDAAAAVPATEALTAAIAAAQAIYDGSDLEAIKAAVAPLKAATALAVNTNAVAGATVAAPVVTNFVVNGTFDTNGVTAPWETTTKAQNQTTATNQTGAFTGNFFENWNPSNYTGKIYQVIENIPNGLYELSICAFASVYDGTAQYVYANADKAALVAGAPTAYIVRTTVTDNKIEIGLEQTAAVNNWMGIDNVSLKFFGEVDENYAKDMYASTKAAAEALLNEKMSAEAKAALEAALAVEVDETSDEALIAAEAALQEVMATVKVSVNFFASNKAAIDAMFALMESTNVYTAEAFAAYSAKAEDFLAQYEAGTLTATVDNPAGIHGWRASVDYDDMLLSAFGVKDFDSNLYINTWSNEGETDGSEFKVPFFEYWTGDDASLGATTKTATMTGLTPGQYYSVEAWVRTRAKNGVAAADATGITLCVGAGEEVDVTEGVVVGESQFAHAVYTAIGAADENGTLTISFNVLADNNVSWLSFKNLKYTEIEMLNVVGAKVGDVDIVEGAATVKSISTIDVTFDRPVALAESEDPVWATLTDKWGDTSLKAEVLEENNCVVRFSLQWDVYTEAGDYYFYVPVGVVVDAENADIANAAIEAVITIEAAPVEPATPLAVVNVTVGENVMEGFSVEAKPTDMIKVNFDGKFYFQGSPVIVDAEGNEAPMAFEYMNGLDLDGSNSYILMGKTAGIYTITLPKAQFNEYEMMGWKAPAEDIVLTVKIVTEGEGIDNIAVDADTVIYDLSGRRVTEMTKGIYIVNGKKVIKK